MLHIIVYDIEPNDKDVINMVFSHTDMSKDLISIHDLKHEDINIEDINAIFAIGKVAIRMIARNLIKSGKIGQSTFVGNDIYNKEASFLFMNAGVNISEVMTSQENKEFFWEKIKLTVEYYKDIFLNNKNPNEDISSMESVDLGILETNSENLLSKEISSYNKEEVLNLLFDKVNLSDPGLMKSLSKYDRFILNTSSGDLVVYPTNRIPDKEDEFFITLKDLVVLLKFSDILDVETIRLDKNNGSDNS